MVSPSTFLATRGFWGRRGSERWPQWARWSEAEDRWARSREVKGLKNTKRFFAPERSNARGHIDTIRIDEQGDRGTSAGSGPFTDNSLDYGPICN